MNEELIEKLKLAIQSSKDARQSPDYANWRAGAGILLSRNQAELFLKLLQQPTPEQVIKNLRSVWLCMAAHPDNTKGSEFEDRMNDISAAIAFLQRMEIQDFKPKQ